MKEIISNKLIIELDEKGEMKNAIFQYRIRENGSIQNKFFTLNVKNGLTIENVNQILQEAKKYAEKGEDI